MKIDETDKKLVNLLLDNARLSYRQLAKKAGVSVATVMNRVKRLEKEGRTLVVRAQRNSKKKARDAVEEEADKDGSDEADDDQEAATSENANDEADKTAEETVSEGVDFETAMQAVKAAVLDTENTELAAKVRRTMGKFMADRSHITKMNEITKADDQEAFCELVETELPELFADDEAGF